MAARPGSAITGARRASARRGACGAATCVQRTESSGVDSHPVTRGMGVAGGRRRGGGRRKPCGATKSCFAGRSYRRPVAPCRIRGSAAPEAADTGLGRSQMWTELWVTCAQIHQMLYFFLRRPQNLVAIHFEMGKKEPGVVPGRLGLRTLVKPPS